MSSISCEFLKSWEKCRNGINKKCSSAQRVGRHIWRDGVKGPTGRQALCILCILLFHIFHFIAVVSVNSQQKSLFSYVLINSDLSIQLKHSIQKNIWEPRGYDPPTFGCFMGRDTKKWITGIKLRIQASSGFEPIAHEWQSNALPTELQPLTKSVPANFTWCVKWWPHKSRDKMKQIAFPLLRLKYLFVGSAAVGQEPCTSLFFPFLVKFGNEPKFFLFLLWVLFIRFLTLYFWIVYHCSFVYFKPLSCLKVIEKNYFWRQLNEKNPLNFPPLKKHFHHDLA